MATEIGTLLTPEQILNLKPSAVKHRFKRGNEPKDPNFKRREEELAQEAAAEWGFDAVVICGNIHDTTTMGEHHDLPRDQVTLYPDRPHLTVEFKCTRYTRSNITAHLYVHVRRPDGSGEFDDFPVRNRPRNYAYHLVETEQVSFFNHFDKPKIIARVELEKQQREEERKRREEEEAKRWAEEERGQQQRGGGGWTYGQVQAGYAQSGYTQPGGYMQSGQTRAGFAQYTPRTYERDAG